MSVLAYSPDGANLLIEGVDRLHVVELRASAGRELVRPELADATWVGDEVWSVTGTPGMLEIEGVAERVAVPGRTGSFAATAPGRAIWIADGTRASELLRTASSIDVRPLGDHELAIPLGPTRLVTCARGTLELRRETSVQWKASVDGRARSGAVLFEGRAVAVEVARAGRTGALVVVDTRTGAIQHKLEICGATGVRFAARRGLVAIVVERERLVLVDLRFGRVVASHGLDRPAHAVAIDDAGQRIALRHGDGACDVVELEVEDVLRAPTTIAMPPPVVATFEVPPPPPTAPPAPTPTAPIAWRAMPALPVRIAPVAVSDAHARALLAAGRTLVAALVQLAMARAWDEGRATPEGAAPLQLLVRAATGTVHGLAEGDLMVASAELDRAFEMWWRAIGRARPGVAPLHVLADEYALGELEQLALLVIAGPALWGELAPLYRALGGCDEHVVTALLAPLAEADAVGGVLDPDAPLVRDGLVRYAEAAPRPFAQLAIEPVVVRRLRGLDARDALDPAFTVRATPCELADFRAPPAILHRLVDELGRARGPLRVVVRGRPASGRRTLCAAIARASGRDLALIDATVVPVESLGQALRVARLAGLVPCLTGLDASAFHPADVRDRVRAAIAEHPGAVCIRLPLGAVAPVELGHVAVDLPTQTIAERAATWTEALARVGLAVPEPDALAARFSLGPGAIERAVAQVAGDGAISPVVDRIELAIGQQLDHELGAIATRVTRLPTWSRVILPRDIQDSLVELVARVRHRRTVFDGWGFDRVMSTSRGLTALFQGGPGTGKTLVAGAIANELGLDLYRVDVSRIMSKWIGETERNLGRLFDAADDGNAILLFDEADSLFTKRTEVKSSTDRFANLEVNYLLQRLDSFDGIAILTTNFGTAIDDAFKRRLSFRLTFPFPDEDQREQLWRAHLPPELPTRGTLELGELARRYQLSGGYIRNCALRAAFLAAEHGGPVTLDHLERAVRAEFRELGKLSTSGILE